MSPEMIALLSTAAGIGLLHTILGPDHYVPFVAMAKARKWSLVKTSVITLLCGLGHVGSSVVLGTLGIGLGIVVSRLEWAESVRGDIAAWLLTGFGLAYLIWGIKQAIRNDRHTHSHTHRFSGEHEHEHAHHTGHVHVHSDSDKASITPWVLFAVFVFGPCEPLIPILMYPAAKQSAWGVAAVAGVFAAATIGTMLVTVLVLTFGLNAMPTGRLARYSHALAGGAILLCGVAIHLGL